MIGGTAYPFGRARYLFGYDGGRGAPAGGQQAQNQRPGSRITPCGCHSSTVARSVHARCKTPVLPMPTYRTAKTDLDLKSRPFPWTTHGPLEPVSCYLQNLSTRPYFFPSFSLLDVPSLLLKKKPVLVWGARLSILFFLLLLSFSATLPSCCNSYSAHYLS